MTDMAGGADERGRGPVEDSEIEALLTGGGTDREELASLGRFLEELRAPYPVFDPQPSAELARLFAEGPGGVLGPAPAAGGRAVTPLQAQRAVPPGRKPVRRLAKVAAATTTAALAVTLAAAAQVLPTQSRSPIGVSGPATPVRVGAGQSVTTVSEVKARVGATATVQQPSTSAAGRPPTTARPVAEADLDALSPEALARLPFDVLTSLSPENLARLPVDVLRILPADTLARLSPEGFRALPADALARLPVDTLKTLPGDVLARLTAEVLRTLPTDALLRLPGDAVRTLPGDLLARLPLDLLRGLPADVQNRLPADILRLLLLSPPPTATASASASVRP